MSSEPESESDKLARTVNIIHALLVEQDLIGSITLIGRKAHHENHLMLEAPWFQAVLVKHRDDITMRILHGDPESLGALALLAELVTTTSLGLLQSAKLNATNARESLSKKFTPEQLAAFNQYEIVRKGGQYDMFDPKAREASGLSENMYLFVMANYMGLHKATTT